MCIYIHICTYIYIYVYIYISVRAAPPAGSVASSAKYVEEIVRRRVFAGWLRARILTARGCWPELSCRDGCQRAHIRGAGIFS